MYKFDYLKKDRLLATVCVYEDRVEFKNYTNDIVDAPFGVRDKVSLKDLEIFYEERVFPKDRVNAKELLKGKSYGFEPLRIIQETHGIMCHDYNWIRFEGENLCWDDVKEWHDHNNVGYRVIEV